MVTTQTQLGLGADTFASPLTQSDGSAMSACLVTSNVPPLKPRDKKSSKSTQTSKSTKTSAQGSTSSEKDLSPYWNKRCRELQSRLWCPTEIDSRGLGSSLSTSYSSDLVDRSLHLISQIKNPEGSTQTYSLDSLPVSAAPTMGSERQERPKTKFVSKKIRVYPENENVWLEHLHASRWAYNQAVAGLRAFDSISKEEREEFKKSDPTRDKTKFRRGIRNKTCEVNANVSRVAIDESVNRAYDSQKALFRKRKAGEKCSLSFKSRKDTKQTFVVQRLSQTGAYPTKLKAHYTEQLPQEAVGKMANVTYENGRWFVTVQQVVAISQVENQDLKVVAVDPGVRTFATTYSEGSCEKIGDKFMSELYPMFLQLDKLIGWRKKFLNKSPRDKRLWSQAQGDRWRFFERRLNRIRNRIKDLTQDLHKRAAHFLTENYDVILLPDFEVSEMTNKTKRKIRTRTVRSMLSLGHYRFGQYLRWVAYKKGKHVVSANEAWTSKTDSRTGEIIEVGPSTTINGLDRDVNGARGIYLRAFSNLS